jgi:iron complex outermembrane receptor protein
MSDNDGSRFAILDEGPGAGLPGIYNNRADLSQYSIELVATGKALDNRLDFAAGMYYFHESGNDGSVSQAITPINTAGLLYYGKIKNDSQSVFGQATYHVSDALAITGGIRYSVDDKRLSSYNGAYPLGTVPTINNVFCLVASVCPAYRSDAFSGISYTASIDYQVRDGLLVYAKTSKGFRSGGQNIRSTSADSFVPFKPEKATSYEGGIKSEFFDRRLRVNLAGYYTVLKDIQRSVSITSPDGKTTANAILNPGQADVYGGEFEASVALPAGLRLDGTVGYTHPKYVRFIDNGFDRSRDAFYGVPKWTASVSPSWTHNFDFGKFLLRADFSYQSDMNISPAAFYTDAGGVLRDAQTGTPTSAADAAGYLRGATDKAHWLINSRAGITVMDGALGEEPDQQARLCSGSDAAGPRLLYRQPTRAAYFRRYRNNEVRSALITFPGLVISQAGAAASLSLEQPGRCWKRASPEPSGDQALRGGFAAARQRSRLAMIVATALS